MHVPPYPAVALRLQRLVNERRSTLAELSKIVAADPTLAAVVVGRASSAGMRGATPVTGLDAALARVGADELVRIALASKLDETARAAGPLAPLRRDAWRRAVLASRLAPELAAAYGVSTGEACLGGLLHDFGTIMAVASLERVGVASGLPILPASEWRIVIGRLRMQFGRVIATRWSLPDAISRFIAFGDNSSPLAKVLHLTERVIAILDRVPGTGIAALLEIQELTTDQRQRIGVALGHAVREMEDLESERPTTPAPSSVGVDAASDASWRIDATALVKATGYEVRTISPDTITFVGQRALLTDWLVETVVQSPTETVEMLANVKSCESRDGEYVITVAPYALAGPPKAAWLRLVAAARDRATAKPAA